MKKYITLLLTASFITSCSYKEDNPFGDDQQALQRIPELMQGYKKAWENDSYWLFTVFPGENKSFQALPATNQGIGGYNFVIKLKDGKVIASSEVASDNNEVTSYFTYNANEAPGVSFDTHNKILHHFYVSSYDYPRGKGGDVEYLIEKEENGTYTFKGKLSGNTMVLTSLTGDRAAFLNKIRENRFLLFGKILAPVQINGKTVNMLFSSLERQIVFSYDGNNVQQAFALTEKGIKFYEPVDVNGVKITELYINNAKTALTTPDGAITINFVNPPIIFNGTDDIKWATFDTGSASQDLLDQYATLNTAVKDLYYWYDLNVDKNLQIRLLHNDDSGYVVGFKKHLSYDARWSGGNDTFYEINFDAVAGHPDQIAISLRGEVKSQYYKVDHPDENLLQNRYSWFASFMYNFYSYIASKSPYTVADDPNNVNYYKLTSVKDSNTWFLLSK